MMRSSASSVRPASSRNRRLFPRHRPAPPFETRRHRPRFRGAWTMPASRLAMTAQSPTMRVRRPAAVRPPEGELLDRAPSAAPAGGSAREIIAVRHLWRRFGVGPDAVIALQDIDFSVRDGEFVSVVGPSGCGKSTLLKILAGLLPASDGEAHLKGTPISGPRRDIGVVFQSPVLFPWRTVLGNCVLPGDVQGLDKPEIKTRALGLLNLVGLSGFEHRYPWQL